MLYPRLSHLCFAPWSQEPSLVYKFMRNYIIDSLLLPHPHIQKCFLLTIHVTKPALPYSIFFYTSLDLNVQYNVHVLWPWAKTIIPFVTFHVPLTKWSLLSSCHTEIMFFFNLEMCLTFCKVQTLLFESTIHTSTTPTTSSASLLAMYTLQKYHQHSSAWYFGMKWYGMTLNPTYITNRTIALQDIEHLVFL